MKKRLWFYTAANVFLLAMPQMAKAATVAGVDLKPNTTNTSTLGSLLSSVLLILIWIATAAAIIYLILYGIQYITAGGDDEKATAARKGIINAIIGIVVIVGLFFIFNAAKQLGTNFNDTNNQLNATL